MISSQVYYFNNVESQHMLSARFITNAICKCNTQALDSNHIIFKHLNTDGL